MKQEADVLVARQRRDERMHRAAELQVAAEADGEAAQPSLLAADGQQVGERLRRMAVAAVAGVDDRHGRLRGGGHRRALLRVAHRDDVGVAADRPHRVGHALALSRARAVCGGKAEHAAAQLEHRRLEAQPRAGTRFEEKSGELFARAGVREGRAVGDDAVRRVGQQLDFVIAQVGDVDQMTHRGRVLLSGRAVSGVSSFRRRGCRGTPSGARCRRGRCSRLRRPPRRRRRNWSARHSSRSPRPASPAPSASRR